MMDPLKIMEEAGDLVSYELPEGEQNWYQFPEKDYQRLRTAIEAQAEELAIALRMSLPGEYEAVPRAELNAMREELTQANDMLSDAIGIIEILADKLCVEHEPHQTFNERLVEAAEKDWYKAYEAASWELAQKEARIARLEGALERFARFAETGDSGGSPQARKESRGLTSDMADEYVWLQPEPNMPPIRQMDFRKARAVRDESPAQSAAHLKAEVLREAVKEIRTVQRSGLKFDPVHTLEGRAARIEREAKEES